LSAHSHLPRLLEEIASVAGLPAAIRIAEAKGGARARIPARLKDDHWLVQAVGRESAEAIAHHFTSGHGTVELDIPLGPAGTVAKARQNVARMIAGGGVSSDAIARATGMSRRTVLRKKAVMRREDDEQQDDLFAKR
jgi:hypothetical protein